MSRRRTLLRWTGLALAAGLAGCATFSPGTGTATQTPDLLYELTGSYTIPSGEFRDLALDIDDPATLDYTVDVQSGPNIDVLALARGSSASTSGGTSSSASSRRRPSIRVTPTSGRTWARPTSTSSSTTPPKGRRRRLTPTGT